MPKGSDALIASRKEEIVSACAQLYENMGFKEITLGDIGKRTSFTRTSIYNYFQTKEEIFLALLQREYEAWISDLEAEMAKQRTLSADALAGMLADTLQRRRCMLKLMSMNLYDMEGNSRMENLVAFKRVYARSMMTVSRCLQSWMPAMKEEDINLPIVAIGGITIDDIPEIMQTGVTGIALSGTILRAENPAEETSRIVEMVERSSC